MIDTLTNGKQRIGLNADQRRQMLEKRIVDSEAMLESLRLDMLAQEAALTALRREMEGE